MTWWLGPAVSAIGSIAGANAKKKEAERMTKRSPEEMEYVGKLKKWSTKGQYPVDQMMAKASIPIQQQAMAAKAQTTGSMIKQGMEHSIVARELMRKTDKDTMASLASQAREIAIKNQASKVQASKDLYAYDQKRQQLLRSAASMKSQANLDMFKGVAGAVTSGVEAFNQYKAPQELAGGILKDGKWISPEGNIIDLDGVGGNVSASASGGGSHQVNNYYGGSGSSSSAPDYDSMSFDEAFAAARKSLGAGQVFTWRGKKYTTDRGDD
tara:strand:- start:7473 stop:8276 length:804 start_codon:yes stop_codon:yes gene_type:complete